MKTPNRPRGLLIALCAIVLAASSLSAAGNVYTVTNVNDGGAGSLRQAIMDANANGGLDEIHFNIAGSGVHTIVVPTSLPGITSPVLIDGYTQPGSSVNTLGIGTNAQLRVEIRAADGATVNGGLLLLVGSSGSTIRGLVINRFFNAQISAIAGDDCVVTGNFIGTDPTATIGYPSAPGTQYGVSLSSDRCRVGGPTNAERNVISGLSASGVFISGDNVVVQGNLIGTTGGGGDALGNSIGVWIGSQTSGVVSHSALIGGINGGATQQPRNVISGNDMAGIYIVSGEGAQVFGNIVGLAAFPIATIPNDGPGIEVFGGSTHTIGTGVSGGENAIVGNHGAGVLVRGPASSLAPQGVYIGGNSIFGNDGLEIDLAVNGVEGVTPNDPLDADIGPNGLQNSPVLTARSYSGGQTLLHGHLSSAANASFRIDAYTVNSCDGSGHGGASNYLGFTAIGTDGSGNADFVFSVPEVLDTGYASVTASDADLATSEFSNCLALGDLLFADGFDG